MADYSAKIASIMRARVYFSFFAATLCCASAAIALPRPDHVMIVIFENKSFAAGATRTASDWWRPIN